MRHLFCLALLGLLTGCLGGVKVKPAPSVYDFGLEPLAETATEGKVRIDSITAAEPLNTNRMRYRLNFKDPSQVLAYTESRWAAQPAELLAAKAGTATSQSACMLQLQLLAFDQVFDSPTASSGIIQFNVVLKDRKSRKVIAHDQIYEKVAASSADAKGGVAALKQASAVALDKAMSWGNTAAVSSDVCR